VNRPCTEVGRPGRPTSAWMRVGGPWVSLNSRCANACSVSSFVEVPTASRARVRGLRHARAAVETLVAQFITYPALISVQSDGASAIIRLKWEGALSPEQIAAALAVSKGVVTKYVGLATAAGLDWATVRGWDEREL